MLHEPENNSQAQYVLNPIGHDSQFWNKGRRHLSRMLDAIEKLSPSGEPFTKDDLRSASGAAKPAIYDLLAKLEDYGKIETVRVAELRHDAKAECPAKARYCLRPGADLSYFREIASAYDYETSALQAV
jgi:uncharacterized protein (DUF58 family)